ncbi:hypothetical protein M0802_000108 [Mischocyttarus mexicanus]|nr:hypothetical protein M0802_000108 [Mischocyttarus mexicanus]
MARALGCLRYLLIVGTVVLGISGIIASTFAGFFLYQLAEYKQLTPDDVYGPSIVLLVLGLFTCAVGWLSWHFLEFTQKTQVILFVISLAIIGLFEITAGIWALVRHEQIDFLPVARLETIFVAKDNKQLWEHVQTKFHCCGMDGPADYRGQNSVPWSCCDTSLSLKSNNDKSTCSSIYARGCHHVMISRARSILLHVFLLGLGGLLLKLCGLAILIVGVIMHINFNNYKDAMKENISFPSVTFIVIGSVIFVIAFFGCCGAIRESHCMTITLECCGVDSKDDYYNMKGNGTIPWSCCSDVEEKSQCPSSQAFKHGCAIALKDFFVYAGVVLGGVAIGIAVVELIGIIFALCLANSIKNSERRGYRV